MKMAGYLRMLSVLLCVSLYPVELPAFQVRGDGTVSDPDTGLLWQQDAAQQMPWLDAANYCKRLELAGSRSWRLPYKDELLSLVQMSATPPMINIDAFPSAPAETYWSLSSRVNQPDRAWAVRFETGESFDFDRSTSQLHVRCLLETAEAIYRPLLDRWASAWADQNIAAYLDCYGASFIPASGIDRHQWELQRRERLTAPQHIEVKLSNIKVISEKGSMAEIRFTQQYHADHYQDQVEKILTVSIESGQVVIVGERTL